MSARRPTIQDAIEKAFVERAFQSALDNLKRDKTAMQFLAGYRTYIIAAALILLCVLHYVGINVPGFTGPTDVGSVITEALGLITARVGATNDAKAALTASLNAK